MCKNSGSTESRIQPGKGGVGAGGSNRARRDGSGSRIDDGEIDGGKAGDDKVGKKVQKSFKSKKMVGSDIFTFRAKLAFTKLRQAFVKAPIPYHFDLKRHIRIETDALGYAIGRVVS